MKPDPDLTHPPPDRSTPPSELLRRGWFPYRFPDTDILVILPKTKAAKFDEKPALYVSYSTDKNGKLNIDFTATLHTNAAFKKQPESALDFVTKLATKKNAKCIDFETYRYFADPKLGGDASREHHFYVIGMSAAVVVVSLTCDAGSSFAPPIEKIRLAIPNIIGVLEDQE